LLHSDSPLTYKAIQDLMVVRVLHVSAAPSKHYRHWRGTLSCNTCDIGKYSNDTAATSEASCKSCPTDETTDSKGVASQDDCDCIEDYTRDCVTNLCTIINWICYMSTVNFCTNLLLSITGLIWRGAFFSRHQQCAERELFFNGLCDICPASGICDGLAALLCTPGLYLTAQTVASNTDTRPICPACPKVQLFTTSLRLVPQENYMCCFVLLRPSRVVWHSSSHDMTWLIISCLSQGCTYSKGAFVPKSPESIGKSAVDLNGNTIFRISACPAGFALTVSMDVLSVVSVQDFCKLVS